MCIAASMIELRMREYNLIVVGAFFPALIGMAKGRRRACLTAFCEEPPEVVRGGASGELLFSGSHVLRALLCAAGVALDGCS